MHIAFSSGFAADIVPYSIVIINMTARYTESTDRITLSHTEPVFITHFTSVRRLYMPYTYISTIIQQGITAMARHTESAITETSATEERTIHMEDRTSRPMAVHTTAFTSLSDEHTDIDRTDIAISPVINEHGMPESRLVPHTALINT